MLTPQDIENKMFKVCFKGYNVDEVDDFLQEVCDSFLETYVENRKLKKQIKNLSATVGQYKSMEETLSSALSVAGKSADEIETTANAAASEIIKNAERVAESIIAGAEQKIAEEAYRLESIKRETEVYKSKIIELLNAQLSVIKGYPRSGSFDAEMEERQEEPAEVKAEAEEIKPDDTERIDKVADDTVDLSASTETADLPFVYLDENGNYVTDNEQGLS